MLYNPPTGSDDPDAGYKGKNASAGEQGSKVPPPAIEMPQREIVNTIIASGQSPTNEDPRQLLKAIRGGGLWTFTDVGATNHIVINPPVVHTASVKGIPFRIFPSFTNTAAVDLKVNGLPPLPIKRRDGGDLLPADVFAGVPFDVVNDGFGAYRMLGFAFSEVPRIVSAPTVYVRTDGNDNNDGSANTADKAFKTIAAAINKGTNKLVLTGRTAAIVLGDEGIHPAPTFPGSFASADASLTSAGTLVIQSYAIANGDTTRQDFYVIQGTGATGMNGIVHASYGSQVILRGLKIQNDNVTTYSSLAGSTNAAIFGEFLTFGGAGASSGAHVYSGDGAVIKLGQGIKVMSGGGRIFHAQGGGITQMAGSQITISGNLTFTDVIARSETLGRILCPGAAGFTGGTVAGTRYAVAENSVIKTFGGGATYFPGSVAGGVSNGGIFA